MCLIAFAVGAHPRWRFVLASNRDEFHARPTEPAAALDANGLRFGGRDAVAGGGWLQVHAAGRVAAVTNVRLGRAEAAERSRGALVAGFIEGTASAPSFVDALLPEAGAYGPFNLLLWDGEAHYLSNHPRPRRRAVGQGVHALSNADLDTPWPKTRALQAALAAWASTAATTDPRSDAALLDPLFRALADRRTAPDATLPDTGVPLDWERRLSAAFIVGADYGTRASTVVLVDDQGLWFEERRFGPLGAVEGRSSAWLPRPSASRSVE